MWLSPSPFDLFLQTTEPSENITHSAVDHLELLILNTWIIAPQSVMLIPNSCLNIYEECTTNNTSLKTMLLHI